MTTDEPSPGDGGGAEDLVDRVRRIAALAERKRRERRGPYRFEDTEQGRLLSDGPEPVPEPEPPDMPDLDDDQKWWNR